MGVDSKRIPPLPAPTDLSSDSGAGAGAADMAATDLSRFTDVTDKTSYSLPEDGSPLTISTNRRRREAELGMSREAQQSQTSLLIEYFEGGKGSQVETRRPSVRVKVTPSSKSRSRSGNGHIQITKSRSGNEESGRSARRPSYTKRIHLGTARGDRMADLDGDGHSLSSYASATEESNVSRNPIEIEVRPRRHGSPLIPDPETAIREQQLGSDVSSMPANSFLDGDLGSRSPDKERGKGFSKADALVQGTAMGATAALVTDTLKAPSRRRSRSLSRERIITQKAAEKVRSGKSEHRHKHSSGSRSRSVSDNTKRMDKHTETLSSPRRRSGRGYQDDSLLSGGDSSLLTSSRLSDQRSYRSGTSTKSSINNPKLLETVEDAIRRLILPELNALKKEHASRDKHDREHRPRRSSVTSSSALSQESRDLEPRSKRSSGVEAPAKAKTTVDERDRERDRNVSTGTVKPYKDRSGDRGSESPRTPRTPRTPRSFERGVSEEPVTRGDSGGRRSGDKRSTFGALAAGIGLGTLASALKGDDRNDSKEYLDEKERAERRRRRAKSRSRSDSLAESYESHREEVPPMPMMSDINASEITRSSILSASTERPRSASGEKMMTPVKDVPRGFVSPSHTPTKSPYASQRSLGMQHSNDSTPNLSRTNLQHHDEYDLNEHGQKVPMNRNIEEAAYEQEYHDGERSKGHGKALAALTGAAAGALAVNAMRHDDRDIDYDEEDIYYQHTQHVPSPLKYVPYNQEKRGLSPIQSVSGYTEADEQERLQKQRDSRATQSTNSKGSFSTLNQSPQRKTSASLRSQHSDPRAYDFKEVRQGGLNDSEISNDADGEYWEEQHQVNERNRDIDQDSYRSSDARMDKYRSGYTDDSEWHENERSAAGQGVRGLGANPDYVHTPIAVESAVASLLEASVLTGVTGGSRSPGLERKDSYDSRLSEQTGSSGRPGVDRKASYASYDEGSEKQFMSRGNAPAAESPGGHGSAGSGNRDVDSHSPYPEYEPDEHGRKVAMPNYQQSSTAKNAAAAGVAGAAAGATAAVIVNRQEAPESSKDQFKEQETIPGAPLQKSFKDRAMDYVPSSPRHSVDKYLDDERDHESLKMSANALPNAQDPMPEFADDASVTTNPSVLNGAKNKYNTGEMDWERGYKTPTPTSIQRKEVGSGSMRPQQSDTAQKATQMGLMDAAPLGASPAAGAAAVNAATGHNREASFNNNDQEWGRTSEDRKRDTLITNPYEGSSPVTLLGGERDRNLLDQLGYEGVKQNVGGGLGYSTGSPGAVPKDEGYISSAPNPRSAGGITPEPKHRGVGFMDPSMGPGEFDIDPFYTPNHQRHLSGMSHGMQSPLYDSALGNNRDVIKSKDIVALMDHLTVRDAQRNARDTEILVTLVRAAAEMRNSFEDMKRLLADTEDVVITEVQRNTDRTVAKAINGPRPLPQSVKSLRSGTGDDDDIPTKRRNVFKRALKGLSMRSTNDLAQIERMLVQLLGDVEGLKVAQGLTAARNYDFDDLEPEGATEQDGGYEPDGHAGTTTASHASQSGHFSNPLSRGTSASQGFGGRKFSENRISTVPEGDEEDIDQRSQARPSAVYDSTQLLTPVRENVRAGSVPLTTPPQQQQQRAEPQSLSTDNTPKTDKSKKHKSTSSWNPLPKISRWSETTASSVARGFRAGGRRDTEQPLSQHTSSRAPSRSGSGGSDLGGFAHDPYGEDKLHSGFSVDNLGPLNQSPGGYGGVGTDEEREQEQHLPTLLPPEDPKYKAHRNSLNLQHPQPRPGQQYQSALERGAADFGGLASPSSVNWGGSQTSLARLPQTNRYSDGSNFDDGTYGNGNDDEQQTRLAPARPPKEPLDATYVARSTGRTKVAKPSPLAAGGWTEEDALAEEPGTPSSAHTYEGSPRAVHRAVSGLGAGGAPARKPTGPRSMGSPRATAAQEKRGKSPSVSPGMEGYW